MEVEGSQAVPHGHRGRQHGEPRQVCPRRIGVPFLGRMPVDPEIARLCDAGRIEEYSPAAFAPMAGELVAGLPEAGRRVTG